MVIEAGLPPGRLDTAESIGWLQALSSVPDPRNARGRRHSLQSVLLLAIGAVLAGASSYGAIENSVHWVRDVTEGENHAGVRTGNGPQVMAAPRNTAINIIRLRGGTNIAVAHRHFSYRPADVLDALAAARSKDRPAGRAAH